MNKNNIKFLHGLPYKPQSQGAVERVHKTIKTSLTIKKLEIGKENQLDLESIISDINQIYNNTIHSVLKATPNEVFFSTNEKFLKTIKKNVLDYYKKKNNDLDKPELDDKVLISSNIVIKENKTSKLKIVEKNKVKKGSSIYIIPGKVIKIHGAEILIY